MQTQVFLSLSTRLMDDLRDWNGEAFRRGTLSADELDTLSRAVTVIERATTSAAAGDVAAMPGGPADATHDVRGEVPLPPNDTRTTQNALSGESVTASEDTLGG